MSRQQNGFTPSLAVFASSSKDERMSFELKEEQVDMLRNQLGRKLVLSSSFNLARQQQSSNGIDFQQWKNVHPCLLTNFTSFERSANNKRVVVFLDYDGTLTPIVKDPERAFLSDHMRTTISQIACLFPTAIVSGRSLEKLNHFVQLSELYYAGSHGMDILGPVKKSSSNPPLTFQPASRFLELINNVHGQLKSELANIEGASVEHNKFCVSAHFRNCDPDRFQDVVDVVEKVAQNDPDLKITKGRKVLEVRPKIDWDKGCALMHLLEALNLSKDDDIHPIYIGDDTTDEDAFRALNQLNKGFGILVSSKAKPTSARYTLSDTIEVLQFLQNLVEWGQTEHNGWNQNGKCNGWEKVDIE